MEYILMFLGICVALFLIKIFFFAILHIIKFGCALFFIIGMPLGFAYLVGWIGSNIAITICKWAFYIGSAYGLILVILHPRDYFRNVFNDL